MIKGECQSLNSIKCVSLGSQLLNTLMLLCREMSRVTWKQRRARTPGVLVAHWGTQSPQGTLTAQRLSRSHVREKICCLNIWEQYMTMPRRGWAQSRRKSCAWYSSCLQMCLRKMILIFVSSQLLYIELGLVNPFLSKQDSGGFHLVLNRRSEQLWIQC